MIVPNEDSRTLDPASRNFPSPMRTGGAIDIPALIDANKVSSFQVRILILLGLIIVIDGFDAQAMAYVAPSIIQEWNVKNETFGPVFGAGLFGMLVGSLSLSVLADKVGRRPVLIGSSFVFALCMLATARVTTIVELQIMRFITGLGLGAIMPNAMALAGEFSPKRKRVTLMMLVSCGFTVGAVLSGLLSYVMIPAFGWQSVFYLGGAIPLLTAVLMYFHVPESMQFLVLRGSKLDRVDGCLRRIDPSVHIDSNTRYVIPEAKRSVTPVAELFHEGRARTTLLLWIVNFMNLLNLYFLSSWLPTIARSAGLSTRTAVLVGAALQVGGMLGTLMMGPAIDRIGFFKVLAPCFLIAAVSAAMIGQPGIPLFLLFTAVVVTGFCHVGGQPAVNALAATYYPTTLRSTGVGWSLGVGRVGSVLGPVLGAELIRRDWSNRDIFLVVAIPAVISALMVMLIAMEKGRGAAVMAGAAGMTKSDGCPE